VSANLGFTAFTLTTTATMYAMNTDDPGESSTSLPLDLTANADAQSSSPLFTVFPAEIRAEIFAIALSRFLDTSHPYPFDSYWYRPGYTAPKKTEATLLMTCKRVYQESRALVWKKGSSNDEEAFWWGSLDRRPPECHGLIYQFHEHEDSDIWDDDDDDDDWYDSNDGSGEEASEGGGNPDLVVEGSADAPSGIPANHSEEDAAYPHQAEATIEASVDEVPHAAAAAAAPSAGKQGSHSSSFDLSSHGHVESLEAPDPRELIIESFLRYSLNDVKRTQSDSPLQSSRQRAFTAAHWSKVTSIHIFPQMYAFSSRAFLRTFIQAEGLRPHTVKVTIRYTDWWNWEGKAALHLSSLVPQLHAYYFPESVSTFIIELESAEHKKSELEAMVKQVVGDKKLWKWKRLDDECLEFDEDAGVREWEWMGTTMFHGQQFAHHPQGETMKYIVKVLTFSAKPTQVEWDGTPFDRALAIKDYEASS
jgi:hypothetical protein